MKSFLLILRRCQADDLGAPEGDVLQRFLAWTQSLHDQGILRSVERLRAAEEGITIRAGADGAPRPEGPYRDAKEDVIGIYLINASNVVAAQAIAANCPIIWNGGSVEVRETDFFPEPQ